MLDASESKGCTLMVRLHVACMLVRPFTAGLGEDGGVLVTAGRLHAPRTMVWLLLSRASLHVMWDPAPLS
jgi:hypothetical protein